MTGVIVIREFGEVETKGGWPHEDEGRRVMLPQAEECQELPGAERGGWTLPRAPKEGMALLAP